MAKMLRFFISWWIALAVLWMFFIGSWKAQELWVGLAASWIATVGGALLGSHRIAWFTFNPKLLEQAWRIPASLVSGTWLLLKALGRQLFSNQRAPSLLRVTRYQATEENETAATQRALAITYTTSTPNSLVLNIEKKRGLLLFHQILPSKISRMTRNLGACS